MNRRNFFLSGAAAALAGLGAGLTKAEAAPARLNLPDLADAPETLEFEPGGAGEAASLEEVQWGYHPPYYGPPPWAGPPWHYGPPPRRRRRRCWIENVRVRYVDRWGRPFWRIEPREVCR